MSDELNLAHAALADSSRIGLATVVQAATFALSAMIASGLKPNLDAALAIIGGRARAVALDAGDESAVGRCSADEPAHCVGGTDSIADTVLLLATLPFPAGSTPRVDGGHAND